MLLNNIYLYHLATDLIVAVVPVFLLLHCPADFCAILALAFIACGVEFHQRGSEWHQTNYRGRVDSFELFVLKGSMSSKRLSSQTKELMRRDVSDINYV